MDSQRKLAVACHPMIFKAHKPKVLPNSKMLERSFSAKPSRPNLPTSRLVPHATRIIQIIRLEVRAADQRRRSVRSFVQSLSARKPLARSFAPLRFAARSRSNLRMIAFPAAGVIPLSPTLDHIGFSRLMFPSQTSCSLRLSGLERLTCFG